MKAFKRRRQKAYQKGFHYGKLHQAELRSRNLMNEFNAIFENDHRDNRLFDINRPLHYAEDGCFILKIAIDLSQWSKPTNDNLLYAWVYDM